jgi:hypothetical protein
VTSDPEETETHEHLSTRPSWDCVACGQPWPCANAKTMLLAEFRDFPSVLAIYMSSQMHEAFIDLTAHGPLPPADLYDRFLGWIRHTLTA